jgi:hypothetical protein
VQDVLLEKTYSPFGPGADDRVNTFMRALNDAKTTLAAQEAANPDAKKRPGYLQAVNTYQLLLKEAGKHIDALRTPERVQEALKGLLPLQPAPPPVPLTKTQTVFQSLQSRAGQTGPPVATPSAAVPSALAPSPVAPQAPGASTGYAVKVRTVLNNVPSALSGLVPPRQQRNTYSEMSDAEADQRVNDYITNLRNEIDRVTAQPGERGKASKLNQLRAEFARVSNILK